MKLKICGMKHPENIQEVAGLHPDYLGFIFYEKSPRFVDGDLPGINPVIKKTGVFVNASLEFIQQKIRQYNLQAVQLHGQESPAFCTELKGFDTRLSLPCRQAGGRKEFSPTTQEKENQNEIPDQVWDDRKLKNADPVEIIKAFSIKDQFNFQELEPYLSAIDYFLFDTKGKHHGGNGETFNWRVLENYPFKKPFFLSGGIGLEHVNELQSFQQKNLPLYAIDVNSKFETDPGNKKFELLKEFKSQLFPSSKRD